MYCDDCYASPARPVKMSHNVGLLFVRQVYTTEAELCRECVGKAFRHHQLYNATLGWWGMISFLATWYFLLANTVEYVAARTSLKERSPAKRSETRVHQQVAVKDTDSALRAWNETISRRVAAGDLVDDIAADLSNVTGVPVASARAFVTARAVDAT